MAKELQRRSPSAPKKIFIVEDHPVFRQGLVQILGEQKDLTVCGEAEDADEALKGIVRLKPDLALIDITLPGKSGLDLIKEIRAVDRTVKLLVVSMHDEALYASRVLRAGGDGYIMKQEDPEEILHAVSDVLNGHIYVSEEILIGKSNGSSEPKAKSAARPKASRLDELSDFELEVLELLGRGKTNQEIARVLKLRPASVTAQNSQIKKKLRLTSTNALIRYAVCWVESAGG